MLTQEQADDLNLQLHAQEAAEIGLAQVNKELDGYYAALEKVSEAMQTATPEIMDRIRRVMPRLIEGYNNAKLKKNTYEDSYLQSTNKINEYNILKALQPSVITQPKRRVVKQGANTTLPYRNGGETLMDDTSGINTQGRTKIQDGTLLSPDGRATMSPSGQVSMGVGIEQTLPYSNGINALYSNRGTKQITPTFTPITTPLDSYRYQSKWYTPKYN